MTQSGPLTRKKKRWQLPGRRYGPEWSATNFLMHGGQNLYTSEGDGAETLTREGWNLRQSQMTQETQLVPGQRQPRALPGCTISGDLLLLVISERTCHSVGASFPEAMMEVFRPAALEAFIECEIQVMRSSPSRKPTIDLCLIPFRPRGCIWSMERRIRGYASVTEESGTSSLSMVDRDPSRYAT